MHWSCRDIMPKERSKIVQRTFSDACPKKHFTAFKPIRQPIARLKVNKTET